MGLIIGLERGGFGLHPGLEFSRGAIVVPKKGDEQVHMLTTQGFRTHRDTDSVGSSHFGSSYPARVVLFGFAAASPSPLTTTAPS